MSVSLLRQEEPRPCRGTLLALLCIDGCIDNEKEETADKSDDNVACLALSLFDS